MVDPLSEIIGLLRPRTVFAKGISGAGRWGVRYSDFGQPSFCTVLEGSCRLAVDGESPVRLEAGDFVLLPSSTPCLLRSIYAFCGKSPGMSPVRKLKSKTNTYSGSFELVPEATEPRIKRHFFPQAGGSRVARSTHYPADAAHHL